MAEAKRSDPPTLARLAGLAALAHLFEADPETWEALVFRGGLREQELFSQLARHQHHATREIAGCDTIAVLEPKRRVASHIVTFWALPYQVQLALGELHRRVAEVVDGAPAVAQRRQWIALREADTRGPPTKPPEDMRWRVSLPGCDVPVDAGVNPRGGYWASMHVASHGNMDVFTTCYDLAVERALPELAERLREEGVVVGTYSVNVGEADDAGNPRATTVYETELDDPDDETWTELAARANIHRETLLFDALVLRYGGAWCAETESPRMGAALSWARTYLKAREVIHDWLRAPREPELRRHAALDLLRDRFGASRPVWTRVPRLELFLHRAAWGDGYALGNDSDEAQESDSDDSE